MLLPRFVRTVTDITGSVFWGKLTGTAGKLRVITTTTVTLAPAVTQPSGKAPVIASHSSVDRLCFHARNLTDSQIQAIAAAGGVVHVNYHRPVLATDTASVTIGTLVDHIDAVVDLAGVDFVGLGSDRNVCRYGKKYGRIKEPATVLVRKL